METVEETTNLKLNCKIAHWEFFFHTPELYEAYDTFAVVSQIKSLMKLQTKADIKTEIRKIKEMK